MSSATSPAQQSMVEPLADRPMHHAREAKPHEDAHAHSSPTPVGFWIYLMSDCVIFGALFATYAVFGAGFIGMEIYEFNHLIHLGAGPDRSAFLSSFFALVGTHGLHVTGGLIWLITLMVQIRMHGLIGPNMQRLGTLSMFWHFLDLVWIGVFSFVYLVRLI